MKTGEYYWMRVRAGLCTRCGSVPARPGKRMCFKCALNEAEYRRGRRAPSSNRHGAPQKYVYSVSSPDGEPCFEGNMNEAAEFVGVTRNRIWQCERDGKPCRGYIIERRLIDDGDED